MVEAPPATEVLGVVGIAHDRIVLQITRGEQHIINEEDLMAFVGDEMDYHDLLGSIPEARLYHGDVCEFQRSDGEKVILRKRGNPIKEEIYDEDETVQIFVEDMEYFLENHCWNIPQSEAP